MSAQPYGRPPVGMPMPVGMPLRGMPMPGMGPPGMAPPPPGMDLISCNYIDYLSCADDQSVWNPVQQKLTRQHFLLYTISCMTFFDTVP